MKYFRIVLIQRRATPSRIKVGTLDESKASKAKEGNNQNAVDVDGPAKSYSESAASSAVRGLLRNESTKRPLRIGSTSRLPNMEDLVIMREVKSAKENVVPKGQTKERFEIDEGAVRD